MNYGFSNRTGKGFTLIEMLVTSILVVLLFGLLFQFLIPALRFSSQGTVRAELQELAVLAMRHLVDDIERTSYAGISLHPNQMILSIHPLVDITQNSRRVYADTMIVYYHDPVRRVLIRRPWPPGPPNLPPPGTAAPRRLSLLHLGQMVDESNQLERIMARSVGAFAVTHGGTGTNI